MKPTVNTNLPGWIVSHMTDYIETDGEVGHMWDSTPVGGDKVIATLLLTTVGRKSGKPTSLPLIYCDTDKGYAVIGSKGGAPENPAWFLNLEAAGEAWVQVKSDHYKVRMRTAEGEERARLWDEMVEIFPPYRGYEEKARGIREIPVVVLERVTTG